MLQDNSSSNEIHSDILSSFEEIVENDIASNEPVQPQNTHNSTPSHIDIGCEPKSSRSKKSDSGCMKGDRAGSLHSPKLTLSCSLISVITSSSMLEEPNPPSYRLLQSSQDIDGGTSMARHLTKVADSGAQDSNKFPSNNNNHNDSFKLTNKDLAAATTTSTASTATNDDDDGNENVKDREEEEEEDNSNDIVVTCDCSPFSSSCYAANSEHINQNNNGNEIKDEVKKKNDCGDNDVQKHSTAAGQPIIVRSKTPATIIGGAGAGAGADAAVMSSSDQCIPIPKSTNTTESDDDDDYYDHELTKIAENYKKTWGIPLMCKLLGGGESTLNSNQAGPISNSTAGSPSSGGTGAGGGGANNNTGGGGWPVGSNQTAGSGGGNAWNASGTAGSNGGGSNAGGAGRQAVVSNSSSNNASHPSNTSQNSGKGGNNSGNQSQVSSQQQQQQQQQQQGGGTGGQQSGGGNTGGATSWAQAAGKNLPPSSSSTASNASPGSAAAAAGNVPASPIGAGNQPSNGGANNAGGNGGTGTNMGSPGGGAGSGGGNTGAVGAANGTNTTASKQQIEDFKSIRDSLFATDGWGGQHVNQDSIWDVPSSPEPAGVAKEGGGNNNATTAMPWKPNVNNGTDLWEANLRNGGQPPPQTTQKTPWGHTPTTNIGGTWGEDDDVGESSNVWSGSSSTSVANPGVQQWGSTPNNPAPMWGNAAKKDEWGNSAGAGNGGAGSGWNDPRDMPRAGNGMDPRNNMVDSSHMRSVIDHRGISGRLNGSNNAEPMWGGPPPQQPPGGPGPHHHVTPTGPPPGPPAQTSKMVPPGGPATVSHWKEMGGVAGNNLGRTGMQCPPGPALPQNRLNTSGLNSAAAAAVAAGIKPDQLWAHPNRNGAWGENGPHDMNSIPWGEEKITPWNEPNMSSWNSSQKPKTPMTPGGWTDGEVDPASWGHASKMAPKNLTKEIVWASKQFRILSEMNFKKDDVENALRASNMNLEDALEYLNATRAGATVNNMDGWRRHDIDASPFDHTTNQPYPSHRFNPQQQLPFTMPPGGNGGGNGAATPSLSNLNPAMVQKLLTQQPPPQQASVQPFNQTSRTTQNQPSAHQLRMLVQQIQMAVSAGYLNHQILNQPLAPQTLILLNQLLQQIKLLQQLQQQATQQSMYPGGQPNKSGAYMTLTVKQQQCKQQIQSLQSQIVATQAVYMKQQQQQSQHHMGAPAQQQGANMTDFFKNQDPLSLLQTNFSDLTLNKDPQMQAVAAGFQNQSKLNQWKLPTSMDKDELNCGNEFSRAPGTTTKSTPASGSPNLNPLLGQSDSTWSNVTNRCESGWPESVNELSDNKDWGSPGSAASNFTDLVPEFEPGKPWKGNQMKSVEDDPNITPGSVVRSPLLSLSTMKDADIFNTTSNAATLSGKTSPTSVDMPLTPLSIPSSSTWSFNPASSVSSSFASPLGKVNNGNSVVSKNAGWGDVNTSSAGNVSDLWAMPKSRGPPPGLTTNSKNSNMGGGGGGASNSNGWGSLGSPRWPSMTNSQNTWMGSPWLLLRNLTPQIDGSTLKTLCMQHGPLNNFHLFLNHGIALAKYNTRDEASKAQGALNSCVLGNTTIFAESPAENEVHSLLQQLNQQSTSAAAAGQNWSRGGAGGGAAGASSGAGGQGGVNQTAKQMQQNSQAAAAAAAAAVAAAAGAGGPTDAWGSNAAAANSSQLWSSALWGAPPGGLETSDPHRATPSSLNSFLPGDLLGGESM